MTSWALLLLASALLGTPGLTFSGLNPERYDLATAHLCDGEQFCQGLAQEGSQGDLLTERERIGIFCGHCRKIVQKLEEMVGNQPTEATVTEAASRVCSKMHRLLRGACKVIMRTCLRRISWDIVAGKKPQAICVDVGICKPQAGECRGDSRDSFLEGPRQPPQECAT
ncbi:hypothetical protein HPG69_003536 [Diceros bicornis minor]|uniref:Saposin B-type domain-containing protein n=2 Tax=Rhinocerotidae TaxID=9803 RepID=A0A7J7EGY8_DICBM|nr:hypothetical protein HPG69_003536 [Diceros bicornis minor]